MKKLANIRLGNSEKLNLLVNLGTMLRAGIPVLDAVDSLLEDTKGNLKLILETLREDLSQGKNISSSFAKFPNTFDPVTVSVLKAAEGSGTLESSIRDVVTNIRKEIEFADKIRTALLYPATILAVFIMVILVILIFVIPRISQVFSNLKIVMPIPTRILIFVSNLLLYQTAYVLGGLVILIGLLTILYIKKRAWLIDKFLSLPGIVAIAREVDLTRFSRSLSLLLGAGIPIVSALELAEKTVAKKEVRLAIEVSREMVVAGKKLSEGFKMAKNIFPRLMIKLIEAGEHSGSLDEALQHVSDHMEYTVSGKIKTSMTLLEPIMLVAIGIIVGGIMLSIVGPIYSLIGQISPR